MKKQSFKTRLSSKTEHSKLYSLPKYILYSIIGLQWNLSKADTIRSKKSVCFIESFPKSQLFRKILKQNPHLRDLISLGFTQERNTNT